ncbi:TetR/AcrR family transcriptional regulator [Candidatus Babeliales bacterium]|nr:TetR/AcrR family transcriptional regulator [Candidatus Babeliales bacterium]
MKKTTKEKILEAAKSLFLERGFAGTSMGDLAKLAEINHSLIFHHFGSKEQLWLAVKQNISQQASLATPVLPSTDLPFRDFLALLFKQSMAFYRNNPEIVRMINWQRLEGQEARNIGVTLSAEMQQWIDAFTHYQECGDINKNSKPVFIVTMVLSIISSAVLDPNIFISSEKDQQDYFDFCLNLLIEGCRN